MPPSISVICTFLNAEDTLAPTLESLRRQRMADARFVLVDDGSTDRSAMIADGFATRDPRFDLHRNPRPGRVRALNFAVAAIDTDYVAVLDADDLAHPGLACRRTRNHADETGIRRHRIRTAVHSRSRRTRMGGGGTARRRGRQERDAPPRARQSHRPFRRGDPPATSAERRGLRCATGDPRRLRSVDQAREARPCAWHQRIGTHCEALP